jgi:hypothetical protein
LDHHFKCLEKIIARLAFHNVKLSVNKSEFAKSKILFLGWIVSHDFIIPDPRRMQKIKDAQFPASKKEVRSFIGLVNSIRRVVPFDVIKQIQILTPLTSSSKTVLFEPTNKHKEAFEKIKALLIKEPLFCNLIQEKSVKYLWVDAASSSGCLGAVLAQRTNPDDDAKILPTHIDLEDPVHRMIYDNGYPYEQCKLYTSLPIELPKPSEVKTNPPMVRKKETLFGFTEENVHNSLFWSILSIYAIYRCKMPESVNELRQLAVKEIKKGILGIKLKDQSFNNRHGDYKTFLNEFEGGQHNIDKDWLLVEALAKATYRCFIILSSLQEHSNKPIFKYNTESNKPPLIFGVYRRDNHIIFTPYYYNKNLEFNIDSLRGKVQIIAYLAKSVPDTFKSRSILDLEVFAILTALHSLQRYISNTKCHLLTDSRVLYYLFHQKIGDSSTKIRRWVLKLLSDYPLITLHFIRTTENLADYLTRQGLPRGDLDKLSLKQITVQDFYDKLPQQEFTLSEWTKFCSDNPQYLTVNHPNVNYITMSLNKGIENLKDLTGPLDILKIRLSRENIIKEQRAQFKIIYDKCLASDNYEFVDTKNKETNTYKLMLNLLFINKEGFKILIPDSMIGLLLSYTHLLGHMGVVKMLANLGTYYFPNMYTTVKKFVGCCYACFMMHGSSRKNKLGLYPIPEYPFQEVSMDLCENLNKVGGYSHLLILQDVLTDYTLIFPLKGKTSNEMSRIFLYSVLQNFNIARVHTDNGPVFRNQNWLRLMAALNIKVVDSSAQNPSSRGKAERAVGIVKTLLKKMLATASSQTLNWELLPFVVSKLINHTVVVRTGYKPISMIMGSGLVSESFFEKESIIPTHHLVKNDKTNIEKLSQELSKMTGIARENLLTLKQEVNDSVNKNRINKVFKEGDIVFVLDRYNLPGNTRPLKTKFFSSPCVVIKSFYTTTLIQRLADGFRSLYSNDHIKLYNGADPMFKKLPPEITKILLHEFKDLLDSEFNLITELDPLNLPTGLNVSDSVEQLTENPISPLPPFQREGRLTPQVIENVLSESDKNVSPTKSRPKSVDNGADNVETDLKDSDNANTSKNTTPDTKLPADQAQENEDKKLEDSGSEEEEEENESEEDDAKVLRSGKRVTFS